ncbi:MAG: hypothetical protein ABWZ79_03710 [Pedobacter agri]
MKKILYILLFVFTLTSVSFAQEEAADDGAEKMRGKMVEYIQTKLGLSKAEAEKFQPVFLDYLKQLRSTKNQYKPDKILLQQKIAELRLRYREQFKPIVGEQRSNEVFDKEREFIQQALKERNDRLQNRQEKPGKKGFRSLLQ